jgi:hypothetical protein
MPLEDIQLLGNEHNADASFRAKFSNHDKLSAFHKVWLKEGSPKPAPFEVKKKALEAIGLYQVEPNSAPDKSNQHLWELATEPDEKTWEYLEKFLTLYKAGEAKGQKESQKNLLRKVKEGNKKTIANKGACSPAKVSAL